MDRVLGSVRRLMKRPDITITFSLFALVYCFLEYILLFPLISGVSSIEGGNIFDSIIHISQLVVNSLMSIRILLCVVIGIMLSGIVFGFILSGCLYKLNNFLAKRKRVKMEFLRGVKKHFLNFSIVSFLVILFSVLFFMFMMVVSVPAVAISRSFVDGNTDLLLLTILFDIITLVILFFGIMFFRIYMCSWFPAVLNFKNRHFFIAKYAADTYFWSVLVRIFTLDAIFILFQYMLLYLNSILPIHGVGGIVRFIILFFLNWIFKSIFFIVMAVLFFLRFLFFKEKVSQE